MTSELWSGLEVWLMCFSPIDGTAQNLKTKNLKIIGDKNLIGD